MPAKKYIVRMNEEERNALIKLVKTGKAGAYKRQRTQILLKPDVNHSDRGLQTKTLPSHLILTAER